MNENSDNKFEISHALEVSRSRMSTRRDDPFENTPLAMGMTLYIDTKISPSQSKPLKTRLVGYSKGQCLILTTPRLEGLPIKYKERTAITVYFLRDRTVYSFKTMALRMIGVPFNFTMFQVPTKVEETALRGSPRVLVGIPFDRIGGDPTKEHVINLSATGALLRLSNKLPIDSNFAVSFFLPNGVSITDIGVSVKRVMVQNGKSVAGVEFDLSHPDFAAIGNYISFVMGDNEIEESPADNFSVDLPFARVGGD